MTGVALRIDGAEETLADLDAMVARLDRPRPMWDAIGASLVVSTQRRFEEGHGPDGSPWPVSYRAALTGGKTLIDSARLMQSITHIASDSGVEVGTNVLYAAIHQLGGIIRAIGDFLAFTLADGRKIFAKSVTIPARPFLGIDEDDETEILRIAEDYVAGPSTGSGQAAEGAP